MITKKISKEMEDKLLKIIFQRYVAQHGYGTRNLSELKFIITSGATFEKDMPEIVEYDPAQNMNRYLFLDIVHELMAKGYMQCSNDNMYYWLTPKGYEHASKNKLQHFITYLNNNSGWAIPLAILSLIVSIIALFVGK